MRLDAPLGNGRRTLQRLVALLVIATLLLLSPQLLAGQEDSTAPNAEPEPESAAEAEAAQQPYSDLVLSDDPIAYWTLNEAARSATVQEARERSTLRGEVQGHVRFNTPGPRPAEEQTGHRNFPPDNTAALFDGQGSHIAIDDTAPDHSLTFDHGDTITVEAWVNPRQIGNNANVYVVGKGRTFNPGYPRENQNWALRIRGGEQGAHVSFLFRSAADHPTAPQPDTDDWHRWTSDPGFAPGSGWRHIAVTYTFGEPETLQGYIDGQPVDGTWDMGGVTTSAPVADDDQVWIGSSMGGSSGNSFNGGIDEVAVYRHAVPAERIAARRQYVPPPPVEPAEAPDDAVIVEILEGIPDREWDFVRPAPTRTYNQDTLAFVDAPRKYNDQALIIDRSAPYLLRASTRIQLPAGEHRLLLRSLNGARLYLDGEVIGTTAFNRLGGHAHHAVEELPDTEVESMPDIRQIPAAHSERFVNVESDGGEHVFMLEAFIGGPRQRFDVGELVVALESADGRFQLLSPLTDQPVELTDQGWRAYAHHHRERIRQVNKARRAAVGKDETEYWDYRHQLVRDELAGQPLPPPPDVSNTAAVQNEIDLYINARLETEGIDPAPLADDVQFLRRVTLDTVGAVPAPQEIRQFFSDPPETRRRKAIDRLLDDPRWADHWVSYWQDVLAENPPLINQALNNSGAFRWYLYEALLDNRPVDRFATDLVMMEGSVHYGGPAGFELATQNDVPMAEKAHTLAQAFMGKNLSCARCHDGPFREFKQEDVFAMAAMLRRGAQNVPASASVPLEDARRMIIDITLEPGSDVQPRWPFDHVLDGDPADIPSLFVRNPNDTRSRMAGLLTWHRNNLFAPVVANRIWRQYLGFGLVEPVDDWFDAEPSHPELLAYLARQLKLSGYDMKELSRLILNSHTYQRSIVGEKAESVDQFTHLFAAPPRRRMSAEQVVDSLFAVAGKDFRSEPLTMDPHSNRPIGSMNHLGDPQRAWQMTTLANERDRPSLNLPMAQKITEVLKAFGWRGNRQDPRSVRDPMPSVQQSAVLANGVVSRRVTGLSDDSAFTEMALQADSPEELVRRIFLRILSREPDADEAAEFTQLLAEGFDDRVVADPPPVEHTPERRHKVTWRNHLGAGSNEIRLEEERLIRQGDPPSVRLRDDWRQRAEDLVWTLINAPEFIMIP